MSEISDQDVTFVRQAIADKEHAVKFWFDSIVEELNDLREKVADKESLAEQVRALEDERDDLQEQVKSLNEECDELEHCREETLLAVMYWLRDFFDHKRVTRSARDVLRQVERALGI